MDDGNELNELLISYLLKELDPEQEKYVAELIKKDQAIQQRYSELETLLRILAIEKTVDHINVSDERLAFEKIKNNGNTTVRTGPPLSMAEGFKRERTNTFRIKRLMTAAACILILVDAGSLFFANRSGTARRPQENKVMADRTPGMRHERNFSGKVRQVVLEDGSIVTLFDRSEIDFPDTFTNNRRDIILKGQANFKVAKDKARPFTVYADHIATTALGTEFTVSNYPLERTITVHLIEGKVVVRTVDSSSINSSHSYYLLAGQQLFYDKMNAVVKIKRPKADKLLEQPNITYKDNPSMPSDKEGSWFMFNNQSLPDVFDELSQIYRVRIKYRRNEIQRFYFIGKFDKKDSLEYILRNIAAINKLTVLKELDGYRIRK